MLTNTDKRIIHDIALKNNLTDYIVEDIVLTMMHETAKLITESGGPDRVYHSINWINFGKFVVTDYRKQRYDKRHKDIDERKANLSERSSDVETCISLDEV